MTVDQLKAPSSQRPPVIETALGVQFSPIVGFTAAHYGWFWKKYLDDSWTRAQDEQRLPTQFERFGDDIGWITPGLPQIIPVGPGEMARILLINSADDRVIQVQNSKFFYNWRKREGDYPSFAENYPEFRRYLNLFQDFLRDANLRPTPHDQWELTYFNQIPKGTLWESLSDWKRIFPGLYGRFESKVGLILAPAGQWRFEIPPQRGRLHIVAQHALLDDKQQVLGITLTARGPIKAGDSEWDLTAGMNIGHNAIVQAFREISSPEALSYWGMS